METKEFEVQIEDGNVVVTVNAHSGKAIRVGVKQADAEALTEILERLHRDYAVRGGHR